jgi:hypothetical protein
MSQYAFFSLESLIRKLKQIRNPSTQLSHEERAGKKQNEEYNEQNYNFSYLYVIYYVYKNKCMRTRSLALLAGSGTSAMKTKNILYNHSSDEYVSLHSSTPQFKQDSTFV